MKKGNEVKFGMENLEKSSCKKCGISLAEDAVFCPKCGTPIQEEVDTSEPAVVAAKDKKQIPKKWIVIGVGVLVALGIIGGVIGGIVSYNQQPMVQFAKQMEAYGCEGAVQVYLENRHDEEFTLEAMVVLLDCEDDIVQKYVSKEITLADATAQLTVLDGALDCSESMDSCSALEASRLAFAEGQSAVDAKDYEAAFAAFEQVIEEDTENFNAIPQIKSDVCDAVCQEAMEIADEKMAEQDYEGAYEILKAVDSQYVTESLTEKIQELYIEADTVLIKQLTNLIEGEAYFEAYAYLNSWSTAFISEQAKLLVDETKPLYSNKAFTEASDLAKNQDYEGAITLLDDYNSQWEISGAQEIIEDYQIMLDKAIILSVKSQVKVLFQTNPHTFTVYTVGSTSISQEQSAYAFVGGFEDFYGFNLVLGCINDNWLLIDSLTIDCDGTQYTYDVDVASNSRDILTSNTFVEIIKLPDVVQSEDYYDLSNLINAMSSAQTVTVYFSGSGGEQSLIVSPNHISEITVMWDIFQAIQRDFDVLGNLNIY